jgi:thioesterase domain-containing protein
MITSQEQLVSSSALPDATQVQLTEIWKQTFGRKGVDGSRLLDRSFGIRRLVRFLKRTEAELGYRIPPTALLRLGTVEAVSTAIQNDTWPEPSPLILMRDGKTSSALYVTSIGDGYILTLCDLIALIDFPGQIWGLQLPGLDGEREPLTSVSEIAQHHVDAILAHQSITTHHIIGFSFGGLVAVEMARILRGCELNVGLVGLLDTGWCDAYWPWSQWVVFTLKKAARRLSNTPSTSPRAIAAYFFTQVRASLRFFKRRIPLPDYSPSPTSSIYYIGGLEPDYQRVRDASIVAFENHLPEPINCKIVLFKAAVGEPRACDPVGLWRRITPDLEVIKIPGSHATMIRRPFVEKVAAEVSLRLRSWC